MTTPKKEKGKSPKRSSEGLALSEFIDSVGVNNRDTGVGSAPQLPEATKRKGRSTAGQLLEKALENPTLVIAGLAAIPLLFLAWGATRRWKKRRELEEESE